MTTRCIGLAGVEPGINANSVLRGIYIHGTPYSSQLGRSASNGCIRMSDNDILTVFNYTLKDTSGERVDGVSPGTGVYISTSAIDRAKGETACTLAGLPGRSEFQAICRKPPASLSNNSDGKQLAILLGKTYAIRPTAVVDQSSLRKSYKGEVLPYKLFLRYSKNKTSNLAFNIKGDSLVGTEYNRSNKRQPLHIELKWDCYGWKGKRSDTEVIEVIP